MAEATHEAICRWKRTTAPIASFSVGGDRHLIRPAYPVEKATRAADAHFFAELRSQTAEVFFDTSMPTTEDVLAWVLRCNNKDDSQMNFIVVDSSGERLAFLALTHIDDDRGTAEFGRVMRVSGGPRGLMQAAMAALFQWAHEALGLTRLRLEVFADNERAIRLYERSNFRRTGSHTRRFLDGRWVRASGPGSRAVLEMEMPLGNG